MRAAKINSVAVIGAGVMGASIAAHIANAGVKVRLLDIVKPGSADRNAIAKGAIEKLRKMDPAPLMGARAIRLITPGNVEDHLAALNEADWIIEAIIERLDIKQDLYRKLEAVRRPDAIISSNTSTIPLKELCAGLSENFARNFCITHFFNPPRYMRLLEVVAGPSTDPQLLAGLQEFADISLGKSVVFCNDTPGFIANRIGTYWVQTAMVLAREQGLEIEEADLIMGKALGFPSTGVFGLLDLVGIDLAPHVNASLARLLPKSDAFHFMNRDTGILETLIAEGYTGNKGKGGFYRSSRGADGKREKSVLKLGAAAQGKLEWRPAEKPEIPEVKDARKDIKKLLAADTKAGKYAWSVVGRVLAYAASLLPEIAGNIHDIDEAMRLGFTWKFGPFELIDKLGADWVVKNLAPLEIPAPEFLRRIGNGSFYKTEDATTLQFGLDGKYSPVPRPEGAIFLSDIKRVSKPVLSNKHASVWDLGDGVLCFEIHAEVRGAMRNMLDGDVIGLLEKTTALVAKGYKALVIYNDDLREQPQSVSFSQGANIGMVQFAANIRMWGTIEKGIKQGQAVYLGLRYAPFPVIGAPVGLALGGGCELLLHCDAVQAYAESYIGLVEVGVGVIPGWGGCTSLLSRWQHGKNVPRGPMPAVAKAFETISTATVSKSAAEAKELMFLRPADGITMNRYRLLADAKARALAMAADYQAPEPPKLKLPGATGRVAVKLVVDGFHKRGIATNHDLTVFEHLANVLTGGDTDYLDTLGEQEVMALERQAFMALIRTKESQARIKSIIDTGKPLRN
jgi:3-hydroxyacyl-CoA dehydrogenase